MRDARGALEDFLAAVKLSPLSAHVYFNRGNLYTSLKRYELAEKDYSEGRFLRIFGWYSQKGNLKNPI